MLLHVLVSVEGNRLFFFFFFCYFTDGRRERLRFRPDVQYLLPVLLEPGACTGSLVAPHASCAFPSQCAENPHCDIFALSDRRNVLVSKTGVLRSRPTGGERTRYRLRTKSDGKSSETDDRWIEKYQNLNRFSGFKKKIIANLSTATFLA